MEHFGVSSIHLSLSTEILVSQDACVYWVPQSRDIEHDGEGFEQTKRNIKDVTFVQNELGEHVEARWIG